MRFSLAAIFLAGLLALGGCGGDPQTPPADTDGDAAAEGAGDDAYGDDAGEPAIDDGEGELPPQVGLSAGQLDPLAKGLAAEIVRIEENLERLQEARSDAAELMALVEIQAERLDAIGAEAAGLETHDYRRLRDELFEHLGVIETRAAAEAQYANVDTTGMDEATAAAARRQGAEVMAVLPDPYVDLDPALAEALRARHPELLDLRNTYVRKLFEAVDGR